MSDSNEKGYYILNEYPSELKTDQSYTYQLTTSPDGDMTDVTYSFGWKFTCDGITTEKIVASGLTNLTYVWTPSNVIFGPLMAKSKSGILNIVITTSTGKSTYVSKDIKLTIADSVRPSISNCTIDRTAYAYNDKSISNRTTHKLSLGVSGLYGASQTITISIGDAVNTIKVDAQPNNQISTVSLELGSFDAGTADSIEKTINIIVTDNRGFTANSTTSVTIYGYTPPTLTATVYRDTNQDAYISFTTNHQNTVAGKTNNINEFYAKCTTGSTTIQTDLKTSPQKLNGTDALENSYDVFVLLTDDVGGKDVKRFVIPNGIPVMDIGADGKTVSFFGTAPESADKLSLKIKDIASFGNEIRLGKSNGNKVIIDNEGMVFKDRKDSDFIHFGYSSESIINGYYFSMGYDNGIVNDNRFGFGSFMAGTGLISETNFQTVVGKYNKPVDASDAMFVVGGGTSETNRENFLTVSGSETSVMAAINVKEIGGKIAAELFGANGSGKLILYRKSDYKLDHWDIIPAYIKDRPCLRFDCYNGSNQYNSADQRLLIGGLSIKTNWNEVADVINCYWSDGNLHNLISRNTDGETSYFGSGNIKYGGYTTVNTTTVLRGGTCKVLNSSGLTTLSDERLKNDFQSLNKWESFFDNLEPCAFKLKNGTSGRYHLGFKAQQVKESLEKSGLSTKDFAGYISQKYVIDESYPEDDEVYKQANINPGDDVYGLIYTEFIALQHHEIQKLKAKVKNLETEINDIKETIKSKEA